MNEQEDGFKQQLINEIENTIENNTIYGNSYGALDNIVADYGNIASDQRVIGRLRSQKEYKDFQNRVDSMNISEGMKQMYKEENPYKYEDGPIDKLTGKFTAGTVWKPNSIPVNTIPESEIQKYVLQIAAKEAGSGETISFLDANGKETPDPSKSVDGQIYKKVGTSYQRLSKDKIRKAYEVAINSIPGAKESLQQDYNYETWKYSKEVEKNSQNGGDTTPYIEGYTDKDGNVYSYDQWLNNKINDFADVSAYNIVQSNVDYGTALQNYNALRQQSYVVGAKTGEDVLDKGFGTIIRGTKDVESSIFAGVEKSVNSANSQALSIFNKYYKDGLKIGNTKGIKPKNVSDIIRYLIDNKKATGPGSTANYLIRDIEARTGNRMSDEDKILLSNSIMGYYNANRQRNNMINNDEKNADGLRFSSDIANNTFSNNNKYSREIIKDLNSYFKYHNTAKWQVGSDVMNELQNIYGTDLKGLINMGISISKNEDGNYDVEIDANHRNLIPKFAYNVREADKKVPGSIGGWFKSKLTFGVGSENYKEYGLSNRSGDAPGSAITRWTHLANVYENGLKAGADAEKKSGVSKGKITYNVLDDGSYTSLFYRENPMGRTDAQLKTIQEESNKYVDNMFAQGNFDSGMIEELDNAGNTKRIISDAQDAKVLIQKMYSDGSWKKDIARACVVPIGTKAGQPKGYSLSFTVPKGADTGKYKEGDHVNFIVTGVAEESINYDPSMNPTILAQNAIQISKATNGVIENFGYDKNLGDTRITPMANGKYKTSIFGLRNNITEDQVETIVASLMAVENMKNNYYNGLYNDPIKGAQFNSNIGEIINVLSTTTNKNPEDIFIMLNNYFKDINE